MSVLSNFQTRNCEEQKWNSFHKSFCENNWAENYCIVVEAEILIEADRDALGEQIFLIVPPCYQVNLPVTGLPGEPTNTLEVGRGRMRKRTCVHSKPEG